MCLDSRNGEIKKKNGNREQENRRKSKAGLAAEQNGLKEDLY